MGLASGSGGSPDVLVIGSGMGGAALAYGLAGTGARVLVLERGGRLPREPENASVEAVFGRRRYQAGEVWEDGAGRAFRPGLHACVGGNTKVYGAAMLRLRERDFDAVEHEGGVSPAWPFGYAELEPWYARAEAVLGVHGEAGRDPTEPWRSGPYPRPPIAHDPAAEPLLARLEGLGLRPFPLPASLDQAPGGACVRCMTCDGFPCRFGAKGDAETRCLDPALARGRGDVRLETGALALRVLTTPDGRRVDGVEVSRGGGAPEVLRAGTVVVAGGAVRSAALLLRSAGPGHPDGLANASGRVGRHYMTHNATAVMAVGRRPTGIAFQKSFALNDWYWGAPGGGGRGPLGNVQMLGKLQAGMLAAALPGVPRPLAAALARRSTDWYVQSEDLPHPESRVTLREGGRIRLARRPTNLGPHRELVRRLAATLRRAGFPLVLRRPFGIETTSHQCGTARFGSDPATSALDPFCRAWGVPNLLVVDGSFMPSSAAVNPALTIAAQALRVAAHLAGGPGAAGAPARA